MERKLKLLKLKNLHLYHQKKHYTLCLHLHYLEISVILQLFLIKQEKNKLKMLNFNYSM